MERFALPIQIRWADIDLNGHLRHSAYFDYGALVRNTFLRHRGMTTDKMFELKFGPIVFREEAIFKREIRLEDELEVDVELVKARRDVSRWSLRHNFIRGDGTLATIINLDGAWIDLEMRKLTIPPSFVKDIFLTMPRGSDFTFEEVNK